MSAAERALPVPRARPRLARYLLRLGAVAALVSLIGYAAISVRVAESFSHAKRQAPEVAASSIAASYEDVSFVTSDGLTLRGWYFPSSRERAVVMVHGKDAPRVDGKGRGDAIARLLLANGYDVLLFDLRGHGASDGDRFSLGAHERKDVAAAVDHLVARGIPERRVGVLGFSMGAGTALQSLALRPGVGAVVADSAYASGRVAVEELAPSVTGLPTAFTPGVIVAAKLFFGVDVDRAEPAAIVRASPDRAFLFIHCTDDRTVYLHHGSDLRAASAHPATELWIASGCGHVGAFAKYPDEYGRRLLAFLSAQMR